jgi:hypothetical protein
MHKIMENTKCGNVKLGLYCITSTKSTLTRLRRQMAFYKLISYTLQHPECIQ